MNHPSVKDVLGGYDALGIRRPFVGETHVVGVRTSRSLPAVTWDDWIGLLTCTANGWSLAMWPGTTRPGVAHEGVAVMEPGLLVDGYVRGTHRGRNALCQFGKTPSRFRRIQQDGTLGPVREAYRGLQIHDVVGAPRKVGSWSEGCQVLELGRWMERLLERLPSAPFYTYALVEVIE